MASQFALLGKKRFLPMFLTQFFGSLNDNIFRQALILVLTYQAAAEMGLAPSLLNNMAAMLFILPFFLFSSTAGQVADKFEKSGLTRKIKLLEITVMLLATIGFVFKLYIFLFIALFLTGIQSTFFGPIKYAYLPQALHKDELVGGNGLFQTGTSLSILIGMIIAGILVNLPNHLAWISAALLLVAVSGYISSRNVPNTPATKPDLALNFNIPKTTLQTISYVKGIPVLLFAVLGVSWFWFYGSTVLTQIPEFTKKILGGEQYVVIFLLMLFSIGVSVGSLLCKKLTNNEVSLKLMPIGLLGLSMFAIDLYFALSNLPPIDENNLQPVSYFLSDSRYYRIFFDLTMLGLAGGFYIVPLYAYLQAYAPATHRARVIAANNIMNALFMVSSAIFAIVVLTVLTLGIPKLFLMTGILNILVGLFIWRKLKQHSVGIERQDV